MSLGVCDCCTHAKLFRFLRFCSDAGQHRSLRSPGRGCSDAAELARTCGQSKDSANKGSNPKGGWKEGTAKLPHPRLSTTELVWTLRPPPARRARACERGWGPRGTCNFFQTVAPWVDDVECVPPCAHRPCSRVTRRSRSKIGQRDAIHRFAYDWF